MGRNTKEELKKLKKRIEVALYHIPDGTAIGIYKGMFPEDCDTDTHIYKVKNVVGMRSTDVAIIERLEQIALKFK